MNLDKKVSVIKIDRLIGILTILLQKEIVTAPELAEKFDVSRRTINRDIEALCKAGIPLVTSQGVGGGISIIEGYKVDKTLFTSKEMKSIFAGLKSLDSVSGDNKYKQLVYKIFGRDVEDAEDNVYDESGHILIDLASHDKVTLAPKIELIRVAIDESKLIKFDYYCYSGESTRVIEPYLLVFQWSSWYVWGFCRDKQDFRFFKLNRLLNLRNIEENYTKRKVPSIQKQIKQVFEKQIHLVAVFDSSVKWRLIEEYGIDSFSVLTDGKIHFEFDFESNDNLFEWILSFGDKVKIISPVSIKEEFIKVIENIRKIY